MLKPIEQIVVVGGGSAGWLTAATIAAEFKNDPGGLAVTLIESDQTGPIGVGEGTWPSMRTTLRKIGISESQFVSECNVSFKQGSTFRGWLHGGSERYTHPFTLPSSYQDINLADHWFPHREKIAFADAVCPQVAVCERGLAPKQHSAPDYAGTVNYGYHLDATRFAEMLRRHAIHQLGVKHIVDHVVSINDNQQGDIESIQGTQCGIIKGDLFIDCSGLSSLLLGAHYGIPVQEQAHSLFNDRALAAQVPYSVDNASIASTTIATARKAGWIWDIGLPSRRGTGYVFSSRHTTEELATEELVDYISATSPGIDAAAVQTRLIKFNPGYRKTFWHRNCVAIGLSAGFVEPLEASALVLVELSARMLADEMPANRAVMDSIARKFNEKFLSRWAQIIDFLKLHYILSQRTDTSYWIDHRSPESISENLIHQLEMWQHRSPWFRDENHVDEMFPSASYQYVLYGMEYDNASQPHMRRAHDIERERSLQLFTANKENINNLVANLPSNRQLIEQITGSNSTIIR